MKMKIEIIPFSQDEFYILEDNVVSYVHCNLRRNPQYQIGDEIDPDKWGRDSFDEVLENSNINEGRKLQYNVLWDLYSKDYPEYFI